MYSRGLPLTRKLKPGVDLPCWFVHQMNCLDDKFHFVFHKWDLLWDDIMNYHTGDLENPRFCIGNQHGEECWGWPLTDGEGNPNPEYKWHVWRRVNDVGWYHVIDIASTEGPHLKRLLELLYKEAKLRDKGRRAYIDGKIEEQEKELTNTEQSGVEKWNYLQDQNRGLINVAKDNFERGHVKPTNPQKETIISYPGQTKRSRIIRPLDDREGGLITWEDLE